MPALRLLARKTHGVKLLMATRAETKAATKKRNMLLKNAKAEDARKKEKAAKAEKEKAAKQKEADRRKTLAEAEKNKKANAAQKARGVQKPPTVRPDISKLPNVGTVSRIGKLLKGLTGIGALTNVDKLGDGTLSAKQIKDRDAFERNAKLAASDAKGKDKREKSAKASTAEQRRGGKPKPKSKPKVTAGVSDAKGKDKREKSAKASAAKSKPKVTGVSDAKGKDKTRSALKNAPRSIAEAKRQGKATFIDKNGNTKAAVTAEDLKKSGHKTLRAYLNAKGKPVKKKQRPS